MNSKRLYFLLIAALVLVSASVFGITYFANTMLASRAQKLTSLKTQAANLESQQTELNKNKKDIEKYAALNKVAETIVPQDKDQAEAVREIVNLADASGISQLSSITFPASTLGAPLAGTKRLANGLTQVTPVAGIPGVYDLQITITQDSTSRVDYSKFITFLGKLENNRRTAQVSNISVQPDARDPSKVAFTLVIDEFLKP